MAEDKFPTIEQLRDRLSDLVGKGFGALPVQILVVPDSTLQAIARSLDHPPPNKPALMIDFGEVSMISADRLGGRAMPTTSAS
jgi:hypothetical protein